MTKFAHLADCHLGGWRDDKLRILGLNAFKSAIDRIILEKCDFMIIAGDFFNTAMPHIDVLKFATKELARLQENSIPVYFIAGSHDYSPSGRSMLHVLENANLMIDVQKARMEDELLVLEYTVDPKTGVKIAGLPGKKGALEKEYYERLDYDLARDEPGRKIFLFHMLLHEFSINNNIEDVPMSILPEGFDYYAGGHPHIVESKNYGRGKIAYTGPLFPNNFEELERLKDGGFYIVTMNDEGKCNPSWISVMSRKVNALRIESNNETPLDLSQRIISIISETNIEDSIFLLRVLGEVDGKVSDIEWHKINSLIISKGAYAYSRNIYSLKTKKDDLSSDNDSENPINEDDMIESISEVDLPVSKDKIRSIFNILSQEKREGETKNDFASRINSEMQKLLDIKEESKN